MATPHSVSAPAQPMTSRPAAVDQATLEQNDQAYCQEILPRVSRTFALCIRLLPPALEHSVLIAYLLCRIADTLEDSADLPAATKQSLLTQFKACLESGEPNSESLRAAFLMPRSDEERLVHEVDAVLR